MADPEPSVEPTRPHQAAAIAALVDLAQRAYEDNNRVLSFLYLVQVRALRASTTDQELE